jgi:salicylate hydroxylase
LFDTCLFSADFLLLHRSTLIKTLLDNLPPPPICRIHTSSRVTGYSDFKPGENDGLVTLHFADNSTKEADVVVGADGIRSAVRDYMFPGGVHVDAAGEKHVVGPKWTGVVAYRTLLTRSMLECLHKDSHRLPTAPRVVCFLLIPLLFLTNLE